MGVGTSVGMLSGIARAKVIALLLGPQGIGFMGVLSSILGTAAAFAGMGLSGSGVREVAAARSKNDPLLLNALQRALRYSAFFFGIAGSALLVLFRDEIAVWVLADESYGWAVGCLGIGALATALSQPQLAWVNGFRRIGDLARIHATSSVAAAAVGIAAVWWAGTVVGVVAAVVSIPVANWAASWWYARRIRIPTERIEWQAVRRCFKPLWTLGATLMLSAAMAMGTQLLARWWIHDWGGLESVGHFHAAWSISILYLGFVLNAMAADYFASLSEASGQPDRLVNLMNQQAYAGLILAGPFVLTMYAFAPFVVSLCYSDAFGEAARVLRWQLLGDLFKVPAWAIGMLLTAQGRSGLFFCTELLWNAIYLAALKWGLQYIGLEAAGAASLIGYAILFFLYWVLVRRLVGFRWSRETYRLVAILGAATLTLALGRGAGAAAFFIQVAVLLGVTAFSFVQIERSLRKDGETSGGGIRSFRFANYFSLPSPKVQGEQVPSKTAPTGLEDFH